MNLWIRTQENSLCKVEDIIEPTCYDNKNWYLSAYTTRGRSVTLGIYKSEKKALEVLDEIQKHIDDIINYDHVESKVYIMPKE